MKKKTYRVHFEGSDIDWAAEGLTKGEVTSFLRDEAEKCRAKTQGETKKEAFERAKKAAYIEEE